jgi:hypothetical protein
MYLVNITYVFFMFLKVVTNLIKVMFKISTGFECALSAIHKTVGKLTQGVNFESASGAELENVKIVACSAVLTKLTLLEA